jgi:hypothetical protein
MHQSFVKLREGLMSACAVVISKYWKMFKAIKEVKLKRQRNVWRLSLLEPGLRLTKTASSATQYPAPSTPRYNCTTISPVRKSGARNPWRVARGTL